MPDSRLGFAAIESPTAGNALWVALDHGRTRIGFAVTPDIYDKYGANVPEEVVKQEAQRAVSPFTLEFVKVDWWTIYSISHRVADHFRYKDAIFLAGDACHTHSSGAAQGLNAGIHDAINLTWKLGGVLNAWYDRSILNTYERERKPVIERLIKLDKTISSLISGTIPAEITGNPNTSAHELLYQVLDSSAMFSLGLGVHYDYNSLNHQSDISFVTPGWRGPDVLLRLPGSRIPLRLYQITKNHGRFQILIFSGTLTSTEQNLHALRSYLDSERSFTSRLRSAFNFVTIIPGNGSQPD